MLLKNPDRRRRGSALLATVGLTITIAMLSAVLLQQSIGHLRAQTGSVDKKRALYLAEAGLAEGLHSLRGGGSGNIGDAATPAGFGNGAFWVETTETQNGLFLVESTAISGGARASLETVVQPVFEEPATFGLVGLSEVAIAEGVVIYPYSSDPEQIAAMIAQLGSAELREALKSLDATLADKYDAAIGMLDVSGVAVADLDTVVMADGRDMVDLPFQLLLGSNGSIKVNSSLASPTYVKGDVLPGPESSVTLGMGAQVSGSTAPRNTKIVPPEIEMPSLTIEPAFTLPGTANLTVGPDERAFSGVTLSSGATLRINGPAKLVTRAMHVAAGARLEIDSTNGPVEIYAANGVLFADRAQIVNVNQDPGGLTLNVTGSTPVDIDKDGTADNNVTLPSAGTLEMQIVAPNTTVAIPSGMQFSGSVIADQLEIGAGATMRYDNALLVGNEQDAGLEVISWQVAEIPAAIAADQRSSMMTRLMIANGGALPSPTDCEKPIEMAAVYETPDGQTRTYRGTAADFATKSADANEVAAVEKVLSDAIPEERAVKERTRMRVARIDQ